MKQVLLLLLLICLGTLASAQICENLFGDSELYRSIRALAALRLELDLAQTGDDDSITISLLRTKYEQKEKAILKHVLQTGLMTQERFKKIIKQEINILQKEGEKIDQARTQQNKDIDDFFINGSIAVFNSFKFEETNSHSLEVTATPITRTTWHSLLALSGNRPREPLPEEFGLLPIVEISYDEVKVWISHLNYLSEKGDKNLDKILKGHRSGDHYRLPSQTEWTILLKSAKAPTGDPESWAARNYEEVTTSKPFNIQGRDYYGLGGLSHFFEQSIIPQISKTWILKGSSEITLDPYTIEVKPNDKNRHNLTFNLIRQRTHP